MASSRLLGFAVRRFSVFGVSTEAESVARKVSSSMEVKLSAATEEVKESFKLGKEENADSASSSGEKHQSAEEQYTFFGQFKSSITAQKVAEAFQKLEEIEALELAKKRLDIMKDELRGNPSKKKHLEYTPSLPFTGERSTRTEMVLTPTIQSKWQKENEIKEKSLEFRGVEEDRETIGKLYKQKFERKSKHKIFQQLRSLRVETIDLIIREEEKKGVYVTKEDLVNWAQRLKRKSALEIFRWMDSKKMKFSPKELAIYVDLIAQVEDGVAALECFKKVDPDFDQFDPDAVNRPAYLKLVSHGIHLRRPTLKPLLLTEELRRKYSLPPFWP